jgi:acetolactate decarboxylase
MNRKQFALRLLLVGLISCNSAQQEKHKEETATYSDIKIVGAMRNVMWKGELGSSIHLDTISNKKGLYGLGPVSYLAGELLINNGTSYVSKVNMDATMTIEKTFDTSAPFFVYGNVLEWNEFDLPVNLETIRDLETFIDEKTAEFKRPFAFKLAGHVLSARIHVQNLPEGAKVSSPDEAHQGQMNYTIANEDVEIIGFFSTEHKGVFTHHDSFLHMHLITKDEDKMGHLDELKIGKMTLYLPKK